jgi:DNA-3-methyladenine glycosylase I
LDNNTQDNFQPEVVSKYGEEKIAALLQDERIIRNKAKVHSVVGNAQAFLKIQGEFGSFDAYIWQFVGGKPKVNCVKSRGEIPAKTPEAKT